MTLETDHEPPESFYEDVIINGCSLKPVANASVKTSGQLEC